MNVWEDVVALRLRDGAKTSKDCDAEGDCQIETTLPPDQYGTVRQTMEITGLHGGRWECLIEKGAPALRSCAPFERDGEWRVERRGSTGEFFLLKQGTYADVAKEMGWDRYSK